MNSQAILILLSLFFTTLWVFLPIKQARHLKVQDDFLKKLHAFKLIAVKRAYPSLSNLSFSEIEKRYNLDQIYDLIGKNRSRD